MLDGGRHRRVGLLVPFRRRKMTPLPHNPRGSPLQAPRRVRMALLAHLTDGTVEAQRRIT